MKIPGVLRRAIMAGGWHVPVPRGLRPRGPVVLTYHGVTAQRDPQGFSVADFAAHLEFLRRHFVMVGPDTPYDKRRGIAVMLTFDDGFRNNAVLVAPLLRQLRIPAMFFVPTRHVTPGRYLWFAYLRALRQHFPGTSLRFRGRDLDMTPVNRAATVAALEAELLAMTPHPTAMYDAIDNELPPLADFVSSADLDDQFAGMTLEQLQELAADPLFTIGAHTTDHPLLTRCTPDEQRRQLTDNRRWLEAVCGRPCAAIAYPGSDYDGGVLAISRDAGFTTGYGDASSRGGDAALEITRIGVHYPSAPELGNKVRWSRAIAYLHARHRATPTVRPATARCEQGHA